MKKLTLFILILFLSGCGIVNATVPIKLSDGTVAVAEVSSYRLFTQANLTYMPGTGLTFSSSSNLAESIASLSMLAEVAGKMYMQSQTGGLAGGSSVPAVGPVVTGVTK
jgi:hypothetical protein